jgi:hypothetical protein
LHALRLLQLFLLWLFVLLLLLLLLSWLRCLRLAPAPPNAVAAADDGCSTADGYIGLTIPAISLGSMHACLWAWCSVLPGAELCLHDCSLNVHTGSNTL